MDTRKTILEELALISPFLAEKRPDHPYTVPDGYFRSLPGLVVHRLTETLPAAPSMPMQVPDGYFEGLASSILQRIKAGQQEEPALPAFFQEIGKKTPFTVPEDYFESLDQRLAPITWNEQTPSVLTLIGRKMPFDVPDGYFKSLPSQVLQKARQSARQGQVYPMSFVRRLYRYAAAAVLVGIVSVGALMYFRSQPSMPAQPATASVDMNSISNDELQNYITGLNVLETDNSIIASNNDLEADDLKEFLNDMPEQALQQYVQEYAQPNTN